MNLQRLQTERFDALVVGAGPAGSSAAYHLARAGARVLLADRWEFPRDKACGDGIVPPAVAELALLGITEADLAPHFQLVEHAETFWPGVPMFPAPLVDQQIVSGYEEGEPLPPYGFVAPRLAFDDLLRRRALEAGADFYGGFQAQTLDWSPADEVGVIGRLQQGENLRLRARFLVAADGSLSRLARLIQQEAERRGFLAQASLSAGAGHVAPTSPSAGVGGVAPASPLAGVGQGLAAGESLPTADDACRSTAMRAYLPAVGHQKPTGLQFYFERDDPTMLYFWIFPLAGDQMNVGVIAIHAQLRADQQQGMRADLRGRLDAFLARYGYDPALLQAARAAPIAMGLRGACLAGPRALCVGDAACLVSPLFAEGISEALASGRLAAQAIISALGNGADDGASAPAIYQAEILARYLPLFTAQLEQRRGMEMMLKALAINS